MCGISGFNWKDEHKALAMVKALSYRGPDASAVWVGDGISLGHDRLSIIDLSSEANQPMSDNLAELSIVFNGEIYNFQELKRELESDYEFRTKSDTEVILAGYRKWGRGVVEKLNGMFAFAIWDKRDQSLFIARDHMGMKPLYYFWDGQRLIFASELVAILEHDVPRILDREAFNHFFRALYSPEPMTLIKDISKLPPAHTLLLKDGSLSIEPYGEMPNSTILSYEEALVRVHGEVQKSVERHLVADVPVGVYLSGGIDSSIVLANMAKMRQGIKTFTIGFDLSDGEESDKFNADFDLAAKTAGHFGTEHQAIKIGVAEAREHFEDVVAHNSDPISNPTSIAMLLLAREAKKGVTVALTGNGGDELFGGYERYRTALSARFLYGRSKLFSKFMFQKDDRLSRVISPTILRPGGEVGAYYKQYLKGRDGAEALMNTDQKSWLPDHFFMLSDKMSMASALEERMPLCDRDLVLLARSLPRKYKTDLFQTKKILKDAFKDELPAFLLNQPKRGWFSPAAKWLRRPEFSTLARELLSPEYYSGSLNLFDWDEVHNILERHIDKREYNLTLIWALMTFQAWARAYKIQV